MKNSTFIILIIVFLAQLAFPIKMIIDNERVLTSGKEYKFLLEPVDPYDPFRGKYITLRYKANEFATEEKHEWQSQENIYVHLTTDSAGFAKIFNVSSECPENTIDYIKAKVDYYYSTSKIITIKYPFESFFMEESKAKKAENAYRNIVRNREQVKVAYGIIFVKEGTAVLKDVILDGIPIREYVKKRTPNS